MKGITDSPYKRPSTWIALAVSVILIILSIILVVHMVNGIPEPEPLDKTPSAGLVYDESATEGGWEALTPEEIEENLNHQLEEGLINISMNTSPIFENGKAKGNLMIVNEPINRHPQKVEIIRNDTQEIIYTSGAIPVGSKIEAAALDAELEAGSYDCTALFHSLDDAGNIIGSAGALISITIKN